MNLDETKRLVDEHLKRELEIMDAIMTLDERDVSDYYDWYMNNPRRKAIEEIKNMAKYEMVG